MPHRFIIFEVKRRERPDFDPALPFEFGNSPALFAPDRRIIIEG